MVQVKVKDKFHIYKQGNIRGDKVEYKGKTNCCIWYPFPGDKDDDAGMCWDFSYEDIDDLIFLLQHLKRVPTDKGD